LDASCEKELLAGFGEILVNGGTKKQMEEMTSDEGNKEIMCLVIKEVKQMQASCKEIACIVMPQRNSRS